MTYIATYFDKNGKEIKCGDKVVIRGYNTGYTMRVEPLICDREDLNDLGVTAANLRFYDAHPFADPDSMGYYPLSEFNKDDVEIVG